MQLHLDIYMRSEYADRLCRIVEAHRDGLTGTDLAAIVGITRQGVNKILRGHSEPGLGVAARLLAAVGATLGDLDGFTPIPVNGRPPSGKLSRKSKKPGNSS